MWAPVHWWPVAAELDQPAPPSGDWSWASLPEAQGPAEEGRRLNKFTWCSEERRGFVKIKGVLWSFLKVSRKTISRLCRCSPTRCCGSMAGWFWRWDGDFRAEKVDVKLSNIYKEWQHGSGALGIVSAAVGSWHSRSQNRFQRLQCQTGFRSVWATQEGPGGGWRTGECTQPNSPLNSHRQGSILQHE